MKINFQLLGRNSCNFCNKGKLSLKGGQVYPYSHLYEVKSDTHETAFRVCPDCAEQFKEAMDYVSNR